MCSPLWFSTTLRCIDGRKQHATRTHSIGFWRDRGSRRDVCRVARSPPGVGGIGEATPTYVNRHSKHSNSYSFYRDALQKFQEVFCMIHLKGQPSSCRWSSLNGLPTQKEKRINELRYPTITRMSSPLTFITDARLRRSNVQVPRK